jgi:hypothetical protein
MPIGGVDEFQHDEGMIKGKFSLLRIANIFNISFDSLRRESEFGKDLKVGSSSGLLKRNEYELIEEDIYNVANRLFYKELVAGNLTIRTVGDYCNHMVRCFKVNQENVIYVLEMNLHDAL